MTKVMACCTTHFHLKQKKIRYGTLAKHARAHFNEFLVAVPFSAAIHHMIDVIFDTANVFQIWSMLQHVAGYDSLTKREILFLKENTCMVVTLLL